MNYFELAQQPAEKEHLISLRRHFHQHPENSLKEFQTATYIEQELDSLKIPHQRVGETGVYGIIQGTGTGSGIVALRADIDALPMDELKTVSYASQNKGVCHACGHDAHTACLLEAARLLQQNRDQFGGEIRLFFQQAEEIGGGARQFIAAGLLKNVDRVFGLHVASGIPSGKILVQAGPRNAAVDHFTIRIHGKGTHVSSPHLGADALYTACNIVNQLQAVTTRCTDPTDSVVIGVGLLQSGTSYNIVAEDAVIEGTTRTFSVENRQLAHEKIDQISIHTAQAFGAQATTEWEDFTSPLINDAVVAKEVTQLIQRDLGEDVAFSGVKPSLGGDDFAEFLLLVPGCYVFLGTGNPDVPGSQVPHHNGNFDLDENALPLGAGVLADYAIWFLTKE